MPFRSFVVGTLLFSQSLSASAATLPTGRYAESRLAVGKLGGNAVLERVGEGLAVAGALAELKARRPADAKFWESLVKKNRLSPKEMIRLKDAEAIPNGWEFTVPGVASRVRLKYGTAEDPRLTLNGKPIDPAKPAPRLYADVKSALEERRAAGAWNWILPSAEANPVVIMPALGALGIVIVVQILGRIFMPPAGQALADYFLDAAAACEKERAAPKPVYEGSATAATLGKLLRADIVTFPSKAGECETFAARLKATQEGIARVGNATEACRAADAFLACAERLKKGGAALSREKTGNAKGEAGSRDAL